MAIQINKNNIDIFPAVLRLAPQGTILNIGDLLPRGDAPQGTRRLDRCRAVIINEVLMVAVDSPSGPEIVFREKLIEQQTNSVEKYTQVRTETDKVIVISKDENCGCGSRLRGWNPYRSVFSTEGEKND
jgi:hypothetical protein